MDSDGVPLSKTSNQQKAQFLDQVCSACPRLTLPGMTKLSSEGDPHKIEWNLVTGPTIAAFC